jgi:excisionase family DNA binding protein
MNQKDLISIKEAASLLGVSALTLRNWDKSGKLKPLRHPLNNYRVYKRADIDILLSKIRSNYDKIVIPKKEKKIRMLKVKHLDEYGDIRDVA